MICPVCEHQQDFGFECDVCGKELGGLDGLGAPPARDEALEGLEPTSSDQLGEVPIERMGDLEVTRFDAVQVAPDVTPDVEHTSADDVGEVRVERMTDLSEDRVADDGVRTALPSGPIICRYCRTPNTSGTICERCGMKLPVVAVAPPAADGKIYDREELKTRCRKCGAPATAGQRCGDCGNAVPLPDA